MTTESTTGKASELEAEIPLCPVHARIGQAGTLELELEIGGNACVACSLNERKELLNILAPFAAPDGSEDSVTVMRRLVASPADAEQLGRLRKVAERATTWIQTQAWNCQHTDQPMRCSRCATRQKAIELAAALRNALGKETNHVE